MRSNVRLPLLLVAAAVAVSTVAPLLADSYTVTLKNGSTFSTRYQPQVASWDATKVVFIDDQGNRISLTRADIASVVSDFENRGFGRSINATTMEMGWAPNDTVEGAQTPQPSGEAPVTFQQFVEPSDLQGIPGAAYGLPTAGQPLTAPGQVVTPPPPPAAAPAPAPPPNQ